MNQVAVIYRHAPWVEYIKPTEDLFNRRAYFFAKRLMDISLILLASPVWLPIFMLVALAIKLESINEPVFFTQYRTGKGGRRFAMYKFRTMVSNAEELKKELAHLNELQWPDFKITNDPRVTKVGRILRKTSLDELPQLLNVLLGDMSLVGPRPTSFSPETYSLWHTERLDVQPGLTGLWQIFARGESEFDDRVWFDIAYIEHQSFRLDILVLFHTVIAVLQQRGTH